MNEGYALRHLRKVMSWDFDQDNRETLWLRLMSDFKYDSYRDFWAGSRFAESLLNWLQQFNPKDRAIAYQLIRDKLVFISFSEMQHLVNRALPVHARQILVSRVSHKLNVPKYLIWSSPQYQAAYQEALKRTLFIGLSDGARIDGFRRANTGVISNDQVAVGYELSDEKWNDLQVDLKERTGDPAAQFELMFLIDDFVGSGTTLLRKRDGIWKGKLPKLADSLGKHQAIFAPDCLVAVHHYVGTERAAKTIEQQIQEAQQNNASWFPTPVSISIDLLLKEDSTLKRGNHPELDAVLDNYYDPATETKSIKEGGTDTKFGFAACGLTLVLEHNTPNNSLGLLWAESPPQTSGTGHCMKPLFRRRQRHN